MKLDSSIEHQALAYASRLQSEEEIAIDLILSNLYAMTGGRRYQRRGEC